MPYSNKHDILIRQDDTDWQQWRVMRRLKSRVGVVKSSLQEWEVALKTARAHAKRTGGSVWRQVGNATPERVE